MPKKAAPAKSPAAKAPENAGKAKTPDVKPPTPAEELAGIKEQLENILDAQSGVEPASIVGAAVERAGSGKLAIVVGHTRVAPGASGVSPVSASEYVWNSDLAQRIVGECNRLGVVVRVFFRDGVGISGAYRAVRQWGATAAVELHFNASNRTARGTETIFGTACAASRGWAQAMQDGMVALYGRTGTADRKIKPSPPHPRGGESVNAMSEIPSCLIEPFFGDNPADARLGQERKTRLAETIVAKFISHFSVGGAAIEAAPAAENTDFGTFIGGLGLRHFTATEILRPTYNSNNGVANSRPPQRLWDNIVPTIVVLDRIRREAGVPITLNSTYRSRAYNSTLPGAASRSQHLDFRAIDFASAGMTPRALTRIARQMRGQTFTVTKSAINLVRDLAPLNAAALNIRSSGNQTTFVFRGGVAEYNSFVHIDCRGEDTDWG